VISLSISGVIAHISPESIASELGLMPGDKILAVNGQAVTDLIDLSFAFADEDIELLVERLSGQQEIFEIEKDYDEDMGIEFESAVFDGVRRCANKCIFCFVDQMAPDMRQSLYVKDDDYRLSFLYGNFVTLTNLTQKDIDRIRRLHLSPLYVSVHATDGQVRARMLNNKRAGDIMGQLKALTEFGVEIHTQVVLCPGENDGEILEKTFSNLYSLHPSVLSLAIVPVGLTKFRDNCHPLRGFTQEESIKIIDMVSAWQQQCRQKDGNSFVYLSDEFYLAAGCPIPEYEFYDGFPQLENGIGLVRSFLAEWQEADFIQDGYKEPTYLDVICGVSAEKVLRPLIDDLKVANLNVRLIPVQNQFFGEAITVTGLLTAQDILDKLKSLPGKRTGIILPGVALRKGEDIFLDDKNPEYIADGLDVPVKVAYSASDLVRLLTAWR
jgi:putative radical SAM enzyme (TIGR03279 family)